MVRKICIQGHEYIHNVTAAEKFFGKRIEIIPCNDTLKLINTARNNSAVYAALLPIENSTTGSFFYNYLLLQKSNLRITGEVYLETENNNYTRFFVLQREDNCEPDEKNKATLYFEIDHSTGTLAGVLSIIARAGINITKLQSKPVPERVWVYGFYTDLEFESLSHFKTAVDLLKNAAGEMVTYGVYKKGQPPL